MGCEYKAHQLEKFGRNIAADWQAKVSDRFICDRMIVRPRPSGKNFGKLVRFDPPELRCGHRVPRLVSLRLPLGRMQPSNHLMVQI
jgi:hypothetical protein